MKKIIGLLVALSSFVVMVHAEDIVVSWSSNGVVMAEGIEPGSICSFEWASTLDSTFTNAAIVFDDMIADANGEIQLGVPMYFRVSATPPDPTPEGMVSIPGGTNSGTNPLGDGESYDSYYPQTYSLTVDSFDMDATEVTNDEMVRVMQWAYDNGKLLASSNSVKNAQGDQQELLDLDSSDCRITWSGGTFGIKSTKGSGYPCVEVTWYGAVAYCNYRSEMDLRTPCYNLSDWSCNFSANGYRLPTSDEWEYAARGGLSSKRFPWGDTITHNQANYDSSLSYSYDVSSTRGFHPDYDDGGYPYTSPVGSFSSNGYGLYDMSGNLWEWCNTSFGSNRGIRGAGWDSDANGLRCGHEVWFSPNDPNARVGFRSVCR